jgi:hypothetical protein
MTGQFEDKWFVIFWYAELVGWMIGGKKSVEETDESAFVYKTDIANLHGTMQARRTGLPQGMAVSGILAGKVSTKNVVVGHCEVETKGNYSCEKPGDCHCYTRHSDHEDHGHVAVRVDCESGWVFRVIPTTALLSYLYIWVIRYRDVSFRVSVEWITSISCPVRSSALATVTPATGCCNPPVLDCDHQPERY